MIDSVGKTEQLTRGPQKWGLSVFSCVVALPIFWLASRMMVRTPGAGLVIFAMGALFAWGAVAMRPKTLWVRVSPTGIEVFRQGMKRLAAWNDVVGVERQRIVLGRADGREVAMLRAAVTLADGFIFYVLPEWPNADAVLGSLALKKFEPTARYDVASGALAHITFPQS